MNTQPDRLTGGRIVWYCSQVVVESSCAVSRNGGLAFEQSRPVYVFNDLRPDTSRLRGPARAPQRQPEDGTAYLPNFACSTRRRPRPGPAVVVVAADEGLSWAIRQVPDGTSPNFDSDPAVDVDEAGAAYVAYENATAT